MGSICRDAYRTMGQAAQLLWLFCIWLIAIIIIDVLMGIETLSMLTLKCYLVSVPPSHI